MESIRWLLNACRLWATKQSQQWLRSRFAPALVALLVALGAILPATYSVAEHPDEAQYVWSAAYYWNRMTRFDFSIASADPDTDPGWEPRSYWAVTQPMGTRLILAVAMHVAGVPAPKLPYLFHDPKYQGPDSAVPTDTLPVVRLAAVWCAALGFSLVAYRFGWWGLIALGILVLPHAREDLARAWAEGPLLLGLGACAASYRTRWFPIVCGAAATFKLTAIITWPLVFLFHPLGRSRYARTLALSATVLTWSVLTPPAWYMGGPPFLGAMAYNRFVEHAGQSAVYGGPLGLFVPSRYLLPLELAVAVGVIILAPHVFALMHRRVASIKPSPRQAMAQDAALV